MTEEGKKRLAQTLAYVDQSLRGADLQVLRGVDHLPIGHIVGRNTPYLPRNRGEAAVEQVEELILLDSDQAT